MSVTEFVTGCRLERGKLKIRDLDHFNAGLASMRDGEYLLTVAKAFATRSPQQNNFWWGVVIERFCEKLGNTPKAMHDILKTELIGEHYLIPDMNGVIVREVTIPGSTAKLTTVKFSELIENAQAFGAELGINVPNPGEYAQ